MITECDCQMSTALGYPSLLHKSHTDAHTHTYAYTQACTHRHTQTHTHTHMHARAHTHTHRHANMPACMHTGKFCP